MDNQRIRNLTTGLLHTKIRDIYEDIEFMVGEQGIMTHQLPNARDALEPFLKFRIGDERFWDGQYDPTHVGELNITPLTDDERETFWKRFTELPHPFKQ